MKRYFLSILLITTFSIAKHIEIDLKHQTLLVKDGKEVILSGDISSGNSMHPTPRGSFRIFKKEKYHKSTLYPIRKNGKRGGAKMNYMLKFAPAIAIHEGNVIYENGHAVPASHGCIRVSKENAMKLFVLMKHGDRVIVKGRSSHKNNFEKKYIKTYKWDEEYIEAEPSPTNIVFNENDFKYIEEM